MIYSYIIRPFDNSVILDETEVTHNDTSHSQLTNRSIRLVLDLNLVQNLSCAMLR